MAIPPEVVQINPDDVDKKQRATIEYLAGVLNNYILQSTNGLNRQLTFGDNFRGEVKSITVTGGSPITFRFEGTGTPRGLILTSYRNTTNATEKLAVPVGIPQWSFDGKRSITVQAIPNLTTDNKYVVTFVILGE